MPPSEPASVHILMGDDELFSALEAYKKLLQWPHQWKVYQKQENPVLDKADFFLIYNKEPEKLDGLRAAQHLRSQSALFPIPILFISEKLSEYARLLADDLDFLHLCELPFHSKNFFEQCRKLMNYIQANLGFLKQLTECHAAIEAQDGHKAKKALNTIAERFQGQHRFQLWMAQVHLIQKEYDLALTAAQKAEKMRPKSMETLNLLASIYFKKGDMDRYQKTLDNTLKLAEIHLQNLLHWGDVYLEQGNAQRSLTAFEAALEKEPANQRAKQGILAAHLVEGRSHIAGAADLASSQSMEIARMFNLKGISMAESGHFRTAERLYNNAMKLLPNKEVAYKLWLNLGLCMKKKGDLKAALLYFEKCKELAPPNYARAEVQIAALKEEINKEAQEHGLGHLREKVKKTSDTINYKKLQTPAKGA